MTTGQQPPAGVTPAADVKNTATKDSNRPRYWLFGGVAFALVGAVLVFALKESHPSVLGVDLQVLGGVLFAAGVLLVAGGAVESLVSEGSALDAEGIKSVGGLIAVVTGIVAVTALTIVTTQTAGLSKESVVAVTSSAFGIISTVIGAYLGIKVSSEASAKTNDALAAVALNEPQKEQGRHGRRGGTA
jgi:hypothetical protein